MAKNFDYIGSEEPDLLTFEGLGGARLGSPPSDYFGAALSKSFSVGHITFSKADWYLSDEFLDFANDLKGRIKIKCSTMAYGLSMGAFGALYWSDFFNIKRALLLSPQADMTKGAIPGETRWSKYKLPEHALGKHTAEMTVIFDPKHKFDKLHAEKISEAGPTNLVPIPFLGHGSAKTLAEAGCLKDMVKAYFKGSHTSESLSALLSEENLSRSSMWLYAKSAEEKGFAREKLLRKSLELDPDNILAAFRLAVTILPYETEEGQEMFRKIFNSGEQKKFMEEGYLRLCRNLSISSVV